MFAAFINALKLTLPNHIQLQAFKFGYYLLVYLFICPPISSFLFFLFHYYIVCYKINLQNQ